MTETEVEQLRAAWAKATTDPRALRRNDRENLRRNLPRKARFGAGTASPVQLGAHLVLPYSLGIGCRAEAVADVTGSASLVPVTRTAAETTLRERRLGVWEQARVIVEKAAAANRCFTDAETLQWDALNSELNDLDARIKALTGAGSARQLRDDSACSYCRATVTGDRCGNCGAPWLA